MDVTVADAPERSRYEATNTEGVVAGYAQYILDGSTITDKGLAAIGRCRNLDRLRLLNRPITDKGVQQLAGLAQLVPLFNLLADWADVLPLVEAALAVQSSSNERR